MKRIIYFYIVSTIAMILIFMSTSKASNGVDVKKCILTQFNTVSDGMKDGDIFEFDGKVRKESDGVLIFDDIKLRRSFDPLDRMSVSKN